MPETERAGQRTTFGMGGGTRSIGRLSGVTNTVAAVRQSDVSAEPGGRRLIELATEIDGWHERFETGHTTVPAGSPLAGDDRASAPYQVSHAVWMALSHATDNLHAFRMATVSGGPQHYNLTTRPYGAYPNLRASMENSSAALWMLSPASRNERLLRRFRWYLADGKSRDAVVGLLGPRTGNTNYTDRVADLQPLVAGRDIDLTACKNRPRFAEIVREAAPRALFDADGAEAIWRILSGMTHGDMWASLSISDAERLAETADGGVMSMRLTTPVDRLASFCEIVCIFLRRAYRLLDERRTPAFA
jgi:hypothetical protein